VAQAPVRNQPLLTIEELATRLDEFYRAIDEFNAGYYFESHETLEDLWMVTPWPERQLFQGIIQLAAAFVHLVRGEYPGIMKLLDASLDKLADFAPERFGVDVTALIAETARVRDEFARLGEARFRQFDEAAAPRIRYRLEGAGA
jgi:predicted metal-dependent hydrolase